MSWTYDRAELLRQLWLDGKTASEIADVIGVTRNSVIGRIHRTHLTRKKKGPSEPSVNGPSGASPRRTPAALGALAKPQRAKALPRPSRPRTDLWTDEDVAALRRLWGTKSVVLIAAEIGRSVNAVNRKGTYLGLGKLSQCPRRHRSAKRSEANHEKNLAEAAASLDLYLAFDPPIGGVTLEELAHNGCHYPLGDPLSDDGFRYCGAFVTEGCGLYCPSHFRLAHAATADRLDKEERRLLARQSCLEASPRP